MRSGKSILMIIGVVTVVVIGGLVLACCLLQPPLAKSPLTNRVKTEASQSDSPGQIHPPNSSPAMQAARNADTSNFDNVLRF